jgi:hypothetical protein
MNVVDNLNSVWVINKPCVYSSTMRLSTFCGLHRDTEQQRSSTLLWKCTIFLEIANTDHHFVTSMH